MFEYAVPSDILYFVPAMLLFALAIACYGGVLWIDFRRAHRNRKEARRQAVIVQQIRDEQLIG